MNSDNSVGVETAMEVQDMIEIGGVYRPSTYEKAAELAEAQEKPILEARQRVQDAEAELLRVCIEQYPVGSRVSVTVAARKSPTHEVVAINERGWMTLRNVSTGIERGMMANSTYISPCKCWYEIASKS